MGASYDIDASLLAAAAAASVVVGGGALVPDEAKHEWERGVAHPYNFVTTARQTKTEDVRAASKWATMSFFENNPQEVKRHMDIMNLVDQAHYDVSYSTTTFTLFTLLYEVPYLHDHQSVHHNLFSCI